jgi:hypothetical protein
MVIVNVELKMTWGGGEVVEYFNVPYPMLNFRLSQPLLRRGLSFVMWRLVGR